MPPIQISSFPIPDWHWGGTVGKLRLYSSAFWLDEDGVPHMQGTTGSPNGFYQEIDLMVSGTNITVPDFLTPATLTSPDNFLVRISGQLWDYLGTPREMLFENWVIPEDPFVATFFDLRIYNRAVALLDPPNTYLNAHDVNALITARLAGIGIVDASDINKGITKLSDPADVPTNPIALGANSSRIGDAFKWRGIDLDVLMDQPADTNIPAYDAGTNSWKPVAPSNGPPPLSAGGLILGRGDASGPGIAEELILGIDTLGRITTETTFLPPPGAPTGIALVVTNQRVDGFVSGGEIEAKATGDNAYIEGFSVFGHSDGLAAAPSIYALNVTGQHGDNGALSTATLTEGVTVDATFVAQGPAALIIGLRAEVEANGVTAAVAEARAIEIKSGAEFNGGAITTLIGLKIDDQLAGAVNYALHTGAGIVHIGALSASEAVFTDANKNLVSQVAPCRLGSAVIDLNGAATKQPVFTVPGGVKCVITGVYVRSFSGVGATAVFTQGWNANANDVIGAITLSAPNFGVTTADYIDATHWGPIFETPPMGNAADVFGVRVTTPEGGALTCTVDVMGYYI